MNKIIICLLLTCISATCYCQQITPSATLSAEYYKSTAKHQRTIALIVGGTGIVLSTGSVTIGLKRSFFDDHNDLALPFYSGLILMAGSVPFIIAANKNSKKAKALATSFRLQQIPPLITAIKSITCYPSVAVTINF